MTTSAVRLGRRWAADGMIVPLFPSEMTRAQDATESMNAEALWLRGRAATIREPTERPTERRVRTPTPERCPYAPLRPDTEPPLRTRFRGRPDAALPRSPYLPDMQLPERGRDASSNPTETSTEEGPALRDALSAAQRADADETAAREARDRLLTEPLPALEPDAELLPHLAQDEVVHALRRRAILRGPGDDRALGYGGTLYLTSRRLIHLGQVVLTVQLTDILETSLGGERLLVTLRNGEGLSLDIDGPRLLRAEMASLLRGLRS